MSNISSTLGIAFKRGIQAIAGPSRVTRTFTSTSRSQEEGLASAYPFSKNYIIPPSSSPSSSSSTPIPENLLHPKNGASLITHINNTIIQTRLDPSLTLSKLFSRRHPNRVLPGSVLTIISYTNPTKTSTSTYSGVLLGIRRRGVDSSFVVRNMVGKIGVESSFKLYSPMIKEIRVVKRADGKSGIRNMGRAKVNYLRDRPSLLASIASALKTKGGK